MIMQIRNPREIYLNFINGYLINIQFKLLQFQTMRKQITYDFEKLFMNPKITKKSIEQPNPKYIQQLAHKKVENVVQNKKSCYIQTSKIKNHLNLPKPYQEIKKSKVTNTTNSSKTSSVQNSGNKNNHHQKNNNQQISRQEVDNFFQNFQSNYIIRYLPIVLEKKPIKRNIVSQLTDLKKSQNNKNIHYSHPQSIKDLNEAKKIQSKSIINKVNQRKEYNSIKTQRESSTSSFKTDSVMQGKDSQKNICRDFSQTRYHTIINDDNRKEQLRNNLRKSEQKIKKLREKLKNLSKMRTQTVESHISSSYNISQKSMASKKPYQIINLR